MADLVEIGKPTPADAATLAENMREIDRREYEAVLGIQPTQLSLWRDVSRSVNAIAAKVNGELVAIYAVTPYPLKSFLSDVGCPWMLCTTEMEKSHVLRHVARASRIEAEATLDGFRYLTNHVAAENVVTIRWLEWLGFDVRSEITVIGGVEFRQFSKESA